MAAPANAGSLGSGELARIRSTADALPHLVWTADTAGQVTFVNRAWIEYTGFRLDMMHLAAKTIVHPDERERTTEAWFATVRDGRPYEIEYRLRRQTDGSYRWFIARAAPIRGTDGSVAGWIGTATDIDEQKRARDTLAFLLEAEESLASFPDIASGFGAFARAAVRQFADWCVVLRAGPDSRVSVIAAVHRRVDALALAERALAAIPADRLAAMTERVRAGGLLVPVLEREHFPELPLHSAVVVPMRSAAGQLYGAIAFLADESRRAFSAADLTVAERVAGRASLAFEVSERLERERRQAEQVRQVETAIGHVLTASSVDVVETARSIARACVPEVADRVTLYFKEDGEHVSMLAVHDVEERMIESGYTLRDRYSLNANEPIRGVLEHNRPHLIAEIDDSGLQQISRDEGYRQVLRAVGLRSSLIVPLRSTSAAGAIGALVLSYCRDDPRRFSADDIPLAQEIAARAAMALETIARRDREHRVSQTFQRAALPAELPAIPGTSLSAWYEAGSTEALIGGDWYDAFRLLDGRLVLSIGDVAGSGLDAAVIMGSVRQSIRTAAVINPNPRPVLDAVDRVVRALGDRYVTAFVAIFDPLLGEMRYASAGHPPPLLRAPDGSVEDLANAQGLPLGLRNLSRGEATVRVLEPGSQLLLYTDGLTELEHDVISGEGRLRDAFAGGVRSARRLFERMTAGRQTRDDVAVLVMNFEGPLFEADERRRTTRWRFATASARSGTTVRRRVRRFLEQAGLAEHELSQAEIVLGELIGNTVRYAPGIAEVFVDTTTALPVLHVLDEGPGWELNPRLPADLLSERGRGLFIVNALSEELSISRRAGNHGSHARVVLRVARAR
jgi:PAS domain S-box-containing protein